MDTGGTRRLRLRVLTLNVWGRAGDWPARRAVLAAGLADLQPDLAALQETVVDDEYDQVVDLFGDAFHVAHQQRRHPDGTGVSIVSRWPLVDVRELDLHVTPRTGVFPCTTLAARVAVPGAGSDVLFVNHLPSWQLAFEHERQLQAVAAARFIESLVDASVPVVVAGDLDADPQAGSIRFWTGRDALDGLSVCYRDAWERIHPGEAGETFTPVNPLMAPAARDWPFRRIDYILVRSAEHAGSALDILDCRRVFDQPIDGTWASDHFGVMAELALPESSA